MLELEAAREYAKVNDDPYIVLNGGKIEVRFNEAGEIIAAYDLDGSKWKSDAFREMVAKSRGEVQLDELPRKDQAIRNRPQAQPALARKKKRVSLRAQDAF